MRHSGSLHVLRLMSTCPNKIRSYEYNLTYSRVAKAAKIMRIKTHPDRLKKPDTLKKEAAKIDAKAAKVGQAADVLMNPVQVSVPTLRQFHTKTESSEWYMMQKFEDGLLYMEDNYSRIEVGHQSVYICGICRKSVRACLLISYCELVSSHIDGCLSHSNAYPCSLVPVPSLCCCFSSFILASWSRLTAAI